MQENAGSICLPRSSPVQRNVNPERKTVACFHIIRRQMHHRRPSQDTQTHSKSVQENAGSVCLPRSSPVKRNVNPERKTVACFHIIQTQHHHRRPSQDTQTHSNSVQDNACGACLPRSGPVKRNVNPERKTVTFFHIIQRQVHHRHLSQDTQTHSNSVPVDTSNLWPAAMLLP